MSLLCQNEWNADVKNLFDPIFPVSDIEVTFTVSGLGYEGTGSGNAAEETPVVTEAPEVTTAPVEDNTAKEEAPVVTEAPEPATEPAKSNTGLVVGIIAGTVVIAGVVVFLVLKKKKNN